MLNEFCLFLSFFLKKKILSLRCRAMKTKLLLSPDQAGKSTVAEASLVLHAQEKQGCAPGGADSCAPFSLHF